MICKIDSIIPRHESNPYRPGAYATAFDILAHAGADGIHRRTLVKLLAQATGKDERRCKWDVAIVLAAREWGAQHRSCRNKNYYVRRNNEHLTLVIDSVVE